MIYHPINDLKSDFEKALNGSILTTAEILYHLPDYPALLQTYIWQDFDYPPFFPHLSAFLRFWESSLEGKIEKVQYTCANSMKTQNFITPCHSFFIH